MSLVGALSGSQVLVRVLDGSTWRYIFGEVSNTSSDSTNAIVTTNVSGARYRTIKAGAGVRSKDITLELIFNDDAGFLFLKSSFHNRSINQFEIVKAGVEGVEIFNGMIVSWNESAVDNDKLSVSVTIKSSGARVVPAELGDFLWGFGDGRLAKAMYEPSSADWWVMTNAQSVAIGETVTFDYIAKANPDVNGILVTSADGTAFFGWGATRVICNFAGFTAKLNGVTINNGDPLPSKYGNPTPPSTPPDDDGRYQLHTIELTATVNTDIKILGRDFTQGTSQRGHVPIGNLTIATAGQTYQWDMDTTGVAAQPESNVGSNDIIIQSFNSIQWRYVGVLKESINNDDRLDMFMVSFQPSLAEALAGMEQPSLRSDGAGKSINFNAMGFGKNLAMANSSTYHLINYAAGFTIELLIVMEAEPAYSSVGGNVGGVGTSDNIVIPIFEMRWDNYAEATATTAILKPCFTLVKRSVNYGNYNQGQTNIEVEVRGTEHPVVGKTYMMIGTLRPSDNTMEFWLGDEDGGGMISQGTAAIPPAWWDNGDQANFGLINPTGNFRGSYTKLMFAKSAGAQTNSSMQDCRIHLLEADQAFATTQYEEALG